MTATGCDLCRAERLTEWFHEDDDCWIAECTICATPMVVWRVHEATPATEVKARLHARLAEVVVRYFDFDHYVDDDMRRIPDHYHAHARPVGGFFGHGRRRRDLG
ncbi:MAG: hypothetical protein ACRD0G_17325 [Acidimicrobiales bacterium]